MEDVIGTVTIPNKFAHRESYEQTIKVYLKYIFNTLLEKTSDHFNLPTWLVKIIKYYIDFSLETQWDYYLIIFGYMKKIFLILVVNFFFGYGSCFTVNDYFTLSKFLISFINSLFFIFLKITLSLMWSMLKILLIMIFLFYEVLKFFSIFLDKIYNYIVYIFYPFFWKLQLTCGIFF